MTLIKWNGTDSTRIRPVKGGDKVNVEPGEVVEVAEDQAKFYTNVGGFALVELCEDCEDCEEVKAPTTETELEFEPSEDVEGYGVIEPEAAEEEVLVVGPEPDVKTPSKKKGKK